MENIHPNQTTIYDFLPNDKCKFIFIDDEKDEFCCNDVCFNCGYIVKEPDCKECNLFESV